MISIIFFFPFVILVIVSVIIFFFLYICVCVCVPGEEGFSIVLPHLRFLWQFVWPLNLNTLDRKRWPKCLNNRIIVFIFFPFFSHMYMEPGSFFLELIKKHSFWNIVIVFEWNFHCDYEYILLVLVIFNFQ